MAISKEIYFDNASSTKPYSEVVEVMKEILDFEYGNSSSIHKLGVNSHRIVKKSTETMADILNCRTDEVVFTSGGAESNNTAIKGFAFANMKAGKNILTSAYEHPTVLNTVKSLEKFGFTSCICGIDKNGMIEKCNVRDNTNENTLLVSIMTVNSETGSYNDIGSIAEEVKAINPKTAVHTDAVQAFCKYKLDMGMWKHLDMMSVSAHKIKGPKGMGALYIRKGTNIVPLIDGGGHQRGRRSGTENTAGIAGFVKAAEIYATETKAYFKHISDLNSYLREKLSVNIEDFVINSPLDGSPYILNIALKGIKSETVVNYMSGKKIYVAAGSACSSKKKGNSHVLESMHVPKEYIEGALRISFNPTNQKEEADHFVSELSAILPILRKLRKK